MTTSLKLSKNISGRQIVLVWVPTAVCTLAKIMTSKGERRKLYRWLKKWRDLKQKEPSLLRRDLRLIEERDMFRDCQCCRKAGQRGRIHPNMMILKGEEGLA